MDPVLITKNLAKYYGNIKAVADVSFEVAKGEIFGLLGPNGAGKTTALECLVGLRRPDAGTIHIAGIDVLAQPARAKEIIGVQLQATALQDKITPRQALRLFGSFYSHPADVLQLIQQFHLEEKADVAFDTLSGGQRQRLAIALALVNQPEILYLDEPTASLDPQSRRDLHAIIAELRSAGRTIVLTTHYIEEAHRLCDRVAFIDRGRVVAMGRPEELIAASKALSKITISTAERLSQPKVEAIATVKTSKWQDNCWQLGTYSATETIISLVHLVETEKTQLLDLQIHRPTLEDVYLELTGIPLND
jgi:ABC-2 type transport system ATP-binding protein